MASYSIAMTVSVSLGTMTPIVIVCPRRGRNIEDRHLPGLVLLSLFAIPR